MLRFVKWKVRSGFGFVSDLGSRPRPLAWLPVPCPNENGAAFVRWPPWTYWASSLMWLFGLVICWPDRYRWSIGRYSIVAFDFKTSSCPITIMLFGLIWLWLGYSSKWCCIHLIFDVDVLGFFSFYLSGSHLPTGLTIERTSLYRSSFQLISI